MHQTWSEACWFVLVLMEMQMPHQRQHSSKRLAILLAPLCDYSGCASGRTSSETVLRAILQADPCQRALMQVLNVLAEGILEIN
mmetsp:Transcript_15867/g.25799  ORF Transcript_15867/g.25799 Transcript_15867/m.25799 type:complete len:84 (+) Transcript_15867:551-802(+)